MAARVNTAPHSHVLARSAALSNKGQKLGLRHGECSHLDRDGTQVCNRRVLTRGMQLNYAIVIIALVSSSEDSRWWFVAMAEFDDKNGWKFHGLNKLLPLAGTGSECQPHIAEILPHVKIT